MTLLLFLLQIYDPTWQEQSLSNFEEVLCNNFLMPVPECGKID